MWRFLNFKVILIVYLAVWFATLLCGTSHSVLSNKTNPWYIWTSSWVLFFFSYCSKSSDSFFYECEIFLQSVMFHWYVTISAFRLKSYCPSWYAAELLYWSSYEGNKHSLMLTSGIASRPASGPPYIVWHCNIPKGEKTWGNCPQFDSFSPCVLPNG